MRYIVLLVVIGLCFAASALAAGSGLPAPVVPDCLGVNIHFTGRNDKHVAKIAEGGFKFIRMDFWWSGIETKKGVYDFTAHEQLLESLTERGIRPIFILDYGNPLYDEGLSPHTDEGRAAFARFAAAGVAHFKGRGVVWELWNEPNGGMFWKPTPNAEDYVKLAKVVYPAVKKADPDAVLIAPALACWEFKYLEEAFKLGLLNHLDAVSVHPYGSAQPEDAYRYYETVRALIRMYGPKGRQIPVVSGEWGYSSFKGFTVDQQGQYLAREFLVNLANRISVSIWYDWVDDGPDPNEKEHHFGTLYLDFSEKPAYKAMQTLTAQLRGYRFAARMDGASDDDYLILFSNGDQTCLAAWTTGKPHKIALPVDAARFSVASLLGDASELAARNGKLEFEVSESVRYIKPVGVSKRWLTEAGWSPSVREFMGKNGLSLVITSAIDSKAPKYEFVAGGKKLEARRLGAGFTVPHVANGSAKSSLTLVARVPELREPLRRTIEFENLDAPIIEVAPPSAETLMIAVSLPEYYSGRPIKGKLHVYNCRGIKLKNTWAPVSLNADASREMLKLKLSERPTGIFSFAIKLVDDAGRDLVVVPPRRYALVETFADGKPGEEVKGYSVLTGGDAKVGGSGRLSYVESPQWGPGSVCAKLDYTLETGWKYVQITPKSPLSISGKPNSAKIWIKGQKNSAPARLRLAGVDDQTFQYKYGTLETRQWEILTVNLQSRDVIHWGASNDGVVRYPLMWDTLLLVDNLPSKSFTGEVFVGPIMLCYD